MDQLSNARLMRAGTTQKHDVTSCDPSSIFLLKSLLFPVTAVIALAASLWLWGESLRGIYFLIGVMTFVGVAEVLDVTQLSSDGSGPWMLRSLFNIVTRWVVLATIICLLLYLSQLSGRLNKHALLTWLVMTPPLLWVAQLAARRLLISVGSRAGRLKNAVIVGLTEQGVRLEKTLNADPLLRIRTVGFFEDRHDERTPHMPSARVVGCCDDVARYVLENDIQIVYITLPMAGHPRVLRVLESLKDSTASVYFVPDIFATNLMQARIDVVHGIPLLAVCESPFFGVLGLVKRLSDIVISGAILLALSPVFLAVALGVRLSSSGPVLFKQRRYGLDGREILVYKFRSMTVTEDGDKSYKQVTRNDARVTPFGAFIRRTSIDELPQFLNVLEGSMSVVGPRPHAIAVNEHYRRLIPSYMMRHKVKPGITGWAQINGYRGGDDLPTMTKRIEYDLDYLSHWSLWFDFQIILRTAAVIWRDRQAY